MEKYPRNDTKQIKFKESVLEFVVRDTAAFSMVEGKGFRNMIYTADPKLTVPCSTTVRNDLEKKYEVVSYNFLEIITFS